MDEIGSGKPADGDGEPSTEPWAIDPTGHDPFRAAGSAGSAATSTSGPGAAGSAFPTGPRSAFPTGDEARSAPSDTLAFGSAGPSLPRQQPGRRRLVKMAALVAAGLIAGAVGITALQHDNATAGASTPVASTGQQGGALPNGGTDDNGGSQGPGGGTDNNGGGQGLGGGGGFGGFGGGVAGETRVLGTVSAVGASSVTVQAAGGSKGTYGVDADTQILRDGNEIALNDLRAGDTVLVHVLPGSGDGVAERILTGSSTTDRRFGGPPPGLPSPDQTSPDQTSPGQSGSTTGKTTLT